MKKEETHQEHSARIPYIPEARDACPKCSSDQVCQCRCPVGDRFCQDCGYEWRTGKLYWLTEEIV